MSQKHMVPLLTKLDDQTSPCAPFTHTQTSHRRGRHSTPRRWRRHLACSTTASCLYLGFCTHGNTADRVCVGVPPLIITLQITHINLTEPSLKLRTENYFNFVALTFE